MDKDYAHLSFVTGHFARSADMHLGRDVFASRARAEQWSLTWEKLAKWKQEAAEMGVPDEIINAGEQAWQSCVTAVTVPAHVSGDDREAPPRLLH